MKLVDPWFEASDWGDTAKDLKNIRVLFMSISYSHHTHILHNSMMLNKAIIIVSQSHFLPPLLRLIILVSSIETRIIMYKIND